MRMLGQVLMGTQGGGQSLFSTIKIAVLPIAKVFTMCFLGFLMASKYVNILPASGRKLLNGVYLPLFLFVTISSLPGFYVFADPLDCSLFIVAGLYSSAPLFDFLSIRPIYYPPEDD